MKTAAFLEDILTPHLLKQIFPSVGPYVLCIIGSGLYTGVVPHALKHAVVQPLLKKSGLKIMVLPIFNPICKHPFLSKVIEWLMYEQLSMRLAEHKVLDVFQSSFQSLHCTESSLICVLNNIFVDTNSGCYVVLLLDLSAAFDTVDHNVLKTSLEEIFDITGSVLLI